jgi:hypothetical protein
MIVADTAFDRFIACLRIFGMLAAGAVLMAGMNAALTPSRSAAGCESDAGKGRSPSAIVSQY